MRTPARVVVVLACLGLGPAALAGAQDSTSLTHSDSTHPTELAPIEVIGRADDLHGAAVSASQGQVGAPDLRLRPLLREGELLETVPGVIVTQHSGDGKANQYFVRGFNLDHGTDFQTTLEGMPVNMPSHAHGQGYTDLNFLIPELVEYLDYRMGVYYPDLGDFGSAGGTEFHLLKRLAHPFAAVSDGSDGLRRLAAGASAQVGGGTLLLGGEGKMYDGPWAVAEELRKLSGVVRYSWERGSSEFSLLAMAYHSAWNASDQIPERAVQSGLISRFGQIDSTDGGTTGRFSLSGTWRHVGERAVDQAILYGIYSHLSLYSDFTYFLDDPVHGDQFNQREHRVVLGGRASRTLTARALGVDHVLTLGLQSRADLVNGLGLYHTEARVRLGTVRVDDVREWGSGLWVEAESRWTSRLRSEIGARADLYRFTVSSDLPANSGDRTAGIVSPKASLIFAPAADVELYLGAGLGFHSNDARGTTIRVDPTTGDPVSRVDPLVRSRGAEFGVRVSPVANLRSTLSVWTLGLNSELLFTGDGGTTEPSAASRRWGVTWANFYRPWPELAFDVDYSLARARFTGVPDTADHIPGALESVLAAGITWSSLRGGAYGSVRVRHFDSYPLIETNSVRATATTLVNVESGVLISGVRVQLSLLNLLDTKASDIQYYYASRLPSEPAAGVADVHFHPVEPRQVRVSLGWGL